MAISYVRVFGLRTAEPDKVVMMGVTGEGIIVYGREWKLTGRVNTGDEFMEAMWEDPVFEEVALHQVRNHLIDRAIDDSNWYTGLPLAKNFQLAWAPFPHPDEYPRTDGEPLPDFVKAAYDYELSED